MLMPAAWTRAFCSTIETSTLELNVLASFSAAASACGSADVARYARPRNDELYENIISWLLAVTCAASDASAFVEALSWRRTTNSPGMTPKSRVDCGLCTA